MKLFTWTMRLLSILTGGSSVPLLMLCVLVFGHSCACQRLLMFGWSFPGIQWLVSGLDEGSCIVCVCQVREMQCSNSNVWLWWHIVEDPIDCNHEAYWARTQPCLTLEDVWNRFDSCFPCLTCYLHHGVIWSDSIESHVLPIHIEAFIMQDGQLNRRLPYCQAYCL